MDHNTHNSRHQVRFGGGLAKTNLREQALQSLREAITTGRSSLVLTWSRPTCPLPLGSRVARSARRCDSCNKKAWWRYPNAVDSASAH